MIDINHLCQNCLNEADLSEEACAYCGQDPNKVPQRSSRCLPQYTILAGRYLIGRVLGEGGFGITYLAMDLVREERVAIKEYFPVDLASRDTVKVQDNEITVRTGEAALHFNNGMRRFETEAQTLRKLEALPGIVSVLDFFSENNTAYLVMEYIEGGNLKNYLKNYIEKNGHAIPCEQSFGMMRPVLDSLRKIHVAGIIHRDISPENILLDENGELVLIDFGSAKTNLASRENRSMTVMVKHGYAPEEQYRTHGDQGPWTDIYAACATLYHMISGILPEDAIERLIGDRMKSLKELDLTPAVPEAYSDIIEKGMQIRGKNRYQSVEALLTDVDVADRAIAEERRKAEEERRKAEEERRRAEEEARLEAGRQAEEEERRKAEEARRKAEEARRKEEERKKDEEAARREAKQKEEQRKRAESIDEKDVQEEVRSAGSIEKKRSGITGAKKGIIIAAVLAVLVLLVVLDPAHLWKASSPDPGNKYPKLSDEEIWNNRVGFVSGPEGSVDLIPAYSMALPDEEEVRFEVMPCSIDGVNAVLKAYYGSVNEKDGVGYVVDAQAEGYGGPVRAVAGFSNEGEVLNVLIDSSHEEEGKEISGTEFTKGFTGVLINTMEEGTEAFHADTMTGVNVISGATISSKAAVNAVNLAVEAFREAYSSDHVTSESGLSETEENAIEEQLAIAEECLNNERWLEAAIAYGKAAEQSGNEEIAKKSLELWQEYGDCNDIIYQPQRLAAINEDGTVSVLCSPISTGDSSFFSNYYEQMASWKNIVSVQFASDSWQLYGLKGDGTIECTNCNCERFGKLTDVIGLASAQYGYVAALCADGQVYWDREVDGVWQVPNPNEWYDIRYITGGYKSLIGIRKDGVILVSYCYDEGEEFLQSESVEIRDFMNENILKISDDGSVMTLLTDQGTVHILENPIEQDVTYYFWMTEEDVQRAAAFRDIVDIENGIFLHADGTVDATGWAWFMTNGWNSISDIVYGYGHPIYAITEEGTIKCFNPYLSETDYVKNAFLNYCRDNGLTDQFGQGLDMIEIMETYGIEYDAFVKENNIHVSEDDLYDAGLADAANWTGLRTRKR